MSDRTETVVAETGGQQPPVLLRGEESTVSARQGGAGSGGSASGNGAAESEGRRLRDLIAWNRYRSRAAAMLNHTAGQGVVALADQVVVSGSRFATTIIIGRVCGPETLGNYTLAFALLILLLGIQEALITVPYMIYGNRLTGEARARLAGSVLVHSWMLGLVATLCLLAAAAAVFFSGGLPGLAPVLLTMACIVPFALLQEFCRRMALAHLRTHAAFALDLSVATIQLGGLATLALLGLLSASAAFAALGAATALAAGTWLLASRSDYQPRRERILPEMRRHWAFGRWVFGGSTVSILYAFSVYWIVAIVLGTKAAGLFAACQAVIMLSNPFLLGISNVLGPRSAQAFAEGGRGAVARVMKWSLLLVVGTMVLFCAAAALLGDPFLRIVYGPEYVGHRLTITVLGLSVLASSIGLVCSAGLCAVERPQVVFLANAIGLAVMLTTVGLLILPLELLGVAAALLIGNVASSTLALGMLWRIVHRPVGEREGPP